jgi:hypothetical protein
MMWQNREGTERDRQFLLRLAEEIKPRPVSDLSALVALNRPGPIRFAPSGKIDLNRTPKT